MRIGVNTLFLIPGDVGGTEVYLRKTLVEMAQQLKDDTLVVFTNLENDIVFREDLAEYPQIEFCRVNCHASMRPARIFTEQFVLPFIVGRKQIDVLWSPGYTAPAICRCPQVVTIHDLQYKSYPEDMKFLERMALAILVKIACWSCDVIITISSFSMREIIRFGFASKEKIQVIPEGVSGYFAVPDSGNESKQAERLAQWGIRKPYLLTVLTPIHIKI